LTYSIRDLFDWFDIITRDQLVVSIEEFDAGLLEGTLSQKQTFDTGKAYSGKSLDKIRIIGQDC